MAHLLKSEHRTATLTTTRPVDVDLYFYHTCLITIEKHYNDLGTIAHVTCTIDFHDRGIIYFRSLDPVLYQTFFRDMILTRTDIELEELAQKYNFL